MVLFSAVKSIKNGGDHEMPSNYKQFNMLHCLTSPIISRHSSPDTRHSSPITRRASPRARDFSSVACHPSFSSIPLSPTINSSCLTQ